jgi:hypothetical protein
VTPEEFKDKWRNTPLTEKQSYQPHFIDLCRLLDVPAPYDGAAEASSYCFEKGAEKTTGKPGWADVWKRGCFGWEYKKSHGDLTKAYAQLQQYAPALENPPLLIVCDTQRFVIHTNFTNTPRVTHEFGLADLVAPETRKLLRLAFTDPDQLKPGVTRESITKDAARHFAALADRLRARGLDPQRVAHFVSRLLFCLFAEDIELFPSKLFSKLLAEARKRPEEFEPMARALFAAMKTGGRLGFDAVPFFNGGLFDDDDALPLDRDDLKLLEKASDLDWAAIDPSIFGTLFERGLDPGKRAQLGKFYTDAETIMKIVEPVVLRPLRREWAETKARIADLQAKAETAKAPAAKTRLRNETKSVFNAFHERLIGVRVLDPACGSGNFLYLALKGLKDLEHQILLDAVEMGVERAFPRIGPESVRGLEINPYAAELARVSIWIGEIQWMMDHGYGISRSPILRALDQIECRDALMNEDGSEAKWPAAEFIVGNPPFLGNKSMRRGLGDEYVEKLRRLFSGRLPEGVDLVCYWFEKARDAVVDTRARRVGLVSTNSIRGGPNRRALDRILEIGTIFIGYSDTEWESGGAAVRVSIVGFGGPNIEEAALLNDVPVDRIHSDLTAGSAELSDLTRAAKLRENGDVAFMATTKGGAFDVSGDLAREWLRLPTNVNGRPNSDVLRPWRNGMDVTRRAADKWIVDFNLMSEACAAGYEVPFEHLQKFVRPEREKNRRDSYRAAWWRFVELRQGMRAKLEPSARFIATPRVAKHRLFVWLPATVCPDSQLIVVARNDDTTLGILHSRFHELWSLRQGSWLGVGNDPRYTPSTTFETFPFPEGLTPDLPAASYAADPRAQRIAAAAAELVRLRDNWLNPPEWVTRVPEVVPGYPDRLLPVPEHAAELKKRTLTNLYNLRPTWLANAHRDLDAAVAAAYGWPADLSDDEVLARLFQLNQERAAAGR